MSKSPVPASPIQRVDSFWVDVRDHLPDSDTTVLIHCPKADNPVWIGYHDGLVWRDVDGADLNDPVKTRVAHWMDLPEPPKEVA